MIASSLWQQFGDLIDEIGNHIFAISMILAALAALHVRVVKPIVRAARTVHDRWGDISEHDEAITTIAADVNTMKNDLSEVNSKVNHLEGITTEALGRITTIEGRMNGDGRSHTTGDHQESDDPRSA